MKKSNFKITWIVKFCHFRRDRHAFDAVSAANSVHRRDRSIPGWLGLEVSIPRWNSEAWLRPDLKVTLVPSYYDKIATKQILTKKNNTNGKLVSSFLTHGRCYLPTTTWDLQRIRQNGFFVGTAKQLVILPPHIPWKWQGGGILCYVTLWTVLVPSPFLSAFNGQRT